MNRKSTNTANISSPPDSDPANSAQSAMYSDNNSSMEVTSRKRSKRKRNRDSSTQGRWTDEEHRLFVDGLKICGKNWKKLEKYVPTRNSTQIRSHAQKYFIKIEKKHHTRDALDFIRSTRDDIASNCSHSVASPRTKIPCDCEIHSKPPQKFGTYLTTDFSKEFEKNNVSCDCLCDKCKGYNRHILNESKIQNIKKRICKAAQKINQMQEYSLPQTHVLKKIEPKQISFSVDTKGQESNFKEINNLPVLRYLMRIYDANSPNG
ncbi:unnamed protein product [Moneuplotes crassus]|uniref:Uncharacterized protein n=1 Tax=Euplotes crassus TaxID=5936 RepID=A0AAD1Y9N7_EUPCR|nr:unnamed protein product [Moneuplotes crassus]